MPVLVVLYSDTVFYVFFFPCADAPRIVKSPSLTKYALQRGVPAYLRCRVRSVPDPVFVWAMTSPRGSRIVDPQDPSKGETVLSKSSYTRDIKLVVY